MDLTRKVRWPRMAKVGPVAADAMNRLATAAERVARLRPQLEDARAELHDAAREAYAHGVSIAAIARVSGLTRQRVHQIVKEERHG
jgi:DNA-binding phage protein